MAPAGAPCRPGEPAGRVCPETKGKGLRGGDFCAAKILPRPLPFGEGTLPAARAPADRPAGACACRPGALCPRVSRVPGPALAPVGRVALAPGPGGARAARRAQKRRAYLSAHAEGATQRAGPARMGEPGTFRGRRGGQCGQARAACRRAAPAQLRQVRAIRATSRAPGLRPRRGACGAGQ